MTPDLEIPFLLTFSIVATIVALPFVVLMNATRMRRPLGIYLVIWLTLAVVLGTGGFFRLETPPLIPALKLMPNIAYIAVPLLIGVAALLIPAYRRTLSGYSIVWLINVQIFRVVGAVFVVLYLSGQLPGEFALPAGIGDILVGLAAPFVAYRVATGKPGARGLAVVWNLLGMADLILAVALGNLTASGPLGLIPVTVHSDIIVDFPLVLIPAFGVPLALLMHIYTLRSLFAREPQLMVTQRQDGRLASLAS